MKKTISLTLVLIMLLSSLCSCNGKKPDESDKNIDKNDDNYNQNIEDDNGGESSEETIDLSEIVEAYKLILKDNTYIHLPSYNGIALADLDQDGIAEIVLRASDEFIILHYFEGQAYPHSLSWREHISKGGTCYWSVQAGREHGTDRIQFNEKKLVYVDRTRIINGSAENAEYYLNGVPTTLEKIQSIAKCNEPIRFSEFNKDNVELLITVDGITNKSLICNCNNSNDDNHNQNIEDDNGGENDDANGQETDPSKLTYEDQPVAVAKDKHGNYYAYVKEWNAYYLMPSDSAFTDEVVRPYSFTIVHDNVAWLLTFNRLEGELSTYKFLRDGETVETYNHICERKGHYDELYGYFYDFYDEDHGYIFFWDEYEALTTRWESTKYLRTDDGGKTWYTPVCETSVGSCCKRDKPIFAKFISENIAVISYENSEQHHGFCGNIGITTDGGRSWKEISSSFPFPESLLTKEWIRSEIIDFEYINNEYLAYARVYGQNGVVVDVTFSSTDLESWKYVKETNISEIIEAYKEYIKDGDMYVKDMVSCSCFALLDYNRDGILDIAMRSGDLYWDNYAWSVLCYENGKLKMRSVPGYQINTKNGEVGWNERAGTIYGGKIYDSSQDKFIKIWRIENDGTENAKYYINDLPVSKDEIMSYFDECDCHEDYEIYKFTEENIEKYITVEAFSDKSYFCSCPEPKTDYDGYCNIINLYKDIIFYKNEGNDVTTFDLSGYTNISSEVSSALKQLVFNNRHQLLGYAFKDINNDGTTELVLLDRDYNIFAIFTSVDKKAVLLDTFGVANNTGAIDKDGRIYKSGYSKGETDYEKVMILTASGELKEEIKYGCSDMEDGQAPRYYKYVSGEKHDITKAEYDELGAQYSSIFSDTAKVTKESGIAFNEIMEFDPK